jgi:hypothetical protein
MAVMGRLPQRLFTLPAAASAMLCVAAMVLWVRRYGVVDLRAGGRTAAHSGVGAGAGRVRWTHVSGPQSFTAGWSPGHHAVFVCGRSVDG